MRPHSRPAPATATTGWMPWMLDLTTRLLASSLNMPEPLLHHAGAFVFAQVAGGVQAAETKAVKALCPISLIRQFQNWRRGSMR